jgi:hypothetical protein
MFDVAAGVIIGAGVLGTFAAGGATLLSPDASDIRGLGYVLLIIGTATAGVVFWAAAAT